MTDSPPASSSNHAFPEEIQILEKAHESLADTTSKFHDYASNRANIVNRTMKQDAQRTFYGIIAGIASSPFHFLIPHLHGK